MALRSSPAPSSERGCSTAASLPRTRLELRLFRTLLELAFVLGLVVVAERRGNQPVLSDRPLLEAADPDAASGPTGAGVRSDERPAILGLVAVHQQVVHEHSHV